MSEKVTGKYITVEVFCLPIRERHEASLAVPHLNLVLILFGTAILRAHLTFALRPLLTATSACPCRDSQTQIAQIEAIRLKNIFVGNLNFNTSEDELRHMFEAYGQVDRVSILTDRETGRSRGFAFVEMVNAEEGDKAITALNGTQLGGRTLNVNEARPKAQGAAGGGRDRGGRGGGRGRY